MSTHVISVFIVIVFVALCAFDVWLDRDKVDGNTYSEIIRKLGKVWPPSRLLIAAFMGALLGHWYW